MPGRTSCGVSVFTIVATVVATFAVAPPLLAQTVLRPLDSVVVQERDGAFLGKLGTMKAGPRGVVYVTDNAESHIVQIEPSGKIAGVFGRKGNGPGELSSPGALTFRGDSLFVLDYAQHRVSVFETKGRQFVRSFPVSVGNFAEITWAGSELLALAIDPTTFAPVTVLSSSGAVLGHEGVAPAIVQKNPMLASIGLQSPAATRGDDRWGATDFSQSIFRWKRGSLQPVEELKVPVVSRRGVNPDLYLQALRDPSKGAALVYNHSTPMVLTFIAPDILALVTFDPTFDKGNFTGPHHLTLIDVKQKKACPDFLLPVSTDPVPKLAVSGDTLVVLQQGAGRNDEVVTTIRRFRIDARRCSWVGMQ